MFHSVYPVLPLLVLAHGWMTLMLAHTLEDDEVASLAPEAFPM